MPRWTAKNQLTEKTFRRLLDEHLFVAMDVDSQLRSVMACSCGKSLCCDTAEHPERMYRYHLAQEIAWLVRKCL